MKNILTVLTVILGLALAGCKTNIDDDNTENWQTLTGSAGIGFWGFGNSPYDPIALLVFIRTSFVSRFEYWEDGEKIHSVEWLNINRDTITYRLPNGQTITQRYFLLDDGLEFNIGVVAGGIFWRRERPSWWSWEFDDSWPTLTGESRNFTGSNGIGFWGARGDPDNPDHVLVFINTSSVSRVEIWVNQQLHNWGHWIDVTGNTIVYRQHGFINPATQRYLIENNNLWLESHFAALAGGGPWLRFERPEWWTLEARQHQAYNYPAINIGDWSECPFGYTGFFNVQ